MRESKAALYGHPLHPMLIVFPLGLLSTSVVFDIINWFVGNGFFSEIGFWLLSAGIIGGLLAAPFGLIDWLNTPTNTRARQVGAIHGLSNVLGLALFAMSWIIRLASPSNPSVWAYILSIAGLLVAVFAGWLGGELVYRMGMGVNPNANLDMPDSILRR